MNFNVLRKLNQTLTYASFNLKKRIKERSSFLYLKSLTSQPVILAAMVSARLQLDNACSSCFPE